MASKPGSGLQPGMSSAGNLRTGGAASGMNEGGVSATQALVWNVGTCRLDAKGEIQAEAPRG